MKDTMLLVRLDEPVTVRRNRATRTFNYGLMSFINPKPPVVKYPETMVFGCDEMGNIWHYLPFKEWHEKPDFERYAKEIGGEIVATIGE